MNRIWILVIALAALTVFVVWIASGSGHVFGTSAGSASFAYSVTLIVLVAASLILGWRGSASQAVRYALVWVALGFALVLGYSYRNDLTPIWQRVSGELNPAMPIQKSGSEVVLRLADDGHFYVDADVNGAGIRMMVDTGASMVVLSEADAERAGIDTNQLDYTLVFSTANGQSTAAEITLDELRIGSIVRRDVRAAVTRGLSGSLLGMSFFNTLSKFSFESDELLLKD